MYIPIHEKCIPLFLRKCIPLFMKTVRILIVIKNVFPYNIWNVHTIIHAKYIFFLYCTVACREGK